MTTVGIDWEGVRNMKHPSADAGNWKPSSESEAMTLLEGLEKVFVDQLDDVIDGDTKRNFDMPNRYRVRTEDEQHLFFLEEEEWGNRGVSRPFIVNALDDTGKIVFNIQRDHAQTAHYCFFCNCGCWDCYRSVAWVKVNNKPYGTIKQNWSIRSVDYDILDADDQKLFGVNGSVNCCDLKAEYDFFKPKADKKFGKIKRYDGGVGQNDNRYKIELDKDLTAADKLLLISTCILFDYRMHYFMDSQHTDENMARLLAIRGRC